MRPQLRKLTAGNAIEIRKRWERGVSKSELARQFNVGVGTINGIVKWETYRDAYEKWED
jgi:DNA-binding transcriptional regulator YiaG